MDYEKKYKEALVNMQELYNSMKYMSSTDALHTTTTLERAFPELKESEDEKIRKYLLKLADRCPEDSIDFMGEVKKEDVVAWLEKQGEDKEINNFDVLPGLYKCVHRLFDGTLDGKLLFEVGNIYKCLSKHDRAEFEVSYGHSVYLEDPVVCKHFIPFEKQGEQNPTWSEEDETALCDALWCCKQAASIAKDENDMGNIWYAEKWLKSLKDRVQSQPRWKPSDDQIAALRRLINLNIADLYDYRHLKRLLEQLEKL